MTSQEKPDILNSGGRYPPEFCCLEEECPVKYENIVEARFLSRPNRFIAQVELNGREETVHVKNTGRCRELLIPGRTVWLEESGNPARKTKYDLIAVDKDGLLINMDAQAPNKVFAEWAGAGHFMEGLALLKPETTWGNSRFDFYWEAGIMGPPREPSAAGPVGREGTAKGTSPHAGVGASGPELVPTRGFVEVKGCTLEEHGLAMFPDAPTERGVKHLRELAAAQAAGYECTLCVILQMKGCRAFCPNERTHPEFGRALRAAAEAGVKVLALDCRTAPDSLTVDEPVPVYLRMQDVV